MTRYCELCSKVLECPGRIADRRVVCTDCAIAAYEENGDSERLDRARRDTDGWWDFFADATIIRGLDRLRIKRGHCPQCGLKH
jgi:hypothetical protein